MIEQFEKNYIETYIKINSSYPQYHLNCPIKLYDYIISLIIKLASNVKFYFNIDPPEKPTIIAIVTHNANITLTKKQFLVLKCFKIFLPTFSRVQFLFHEKVQK